MIFSYSDLINIIKTFFIFQRKIVELPEFFSLLLHVLIHVPKATFSVFLTDVSDNRLGAKKIALNQTDNIDTLDRSK